MLELCFEIGAACKKKAVEQRHSQRVVVSHDAST